jgi:hypothetical protein
MRALTIDYRAFASTGPRSIERGMHQDRLIPVRRQRASTGPRSIERGMFAISLGLKEEYLQLQRGRAQLSAEWRGPRC